MNNIGKGIWKISLGNPEAFTPVKLSETKINHEGLDSLPDANISPFNEKDISFNANHKGCTFSIPMSRTERIYGFGLQLYSLEQTSTKKHLRVNSDPVKDTGDSHAPVPFYVSTAGYGVFVDTSRYASFYCGSHLPAGTSKNIVNEEKEIGDSVESLYATKELETNTKMLVDIPYAQGADIYIFSGPSMVNAVQRYNLFSGSGTMPAMWGLGVWYRGYVRSNTQDILNFIDYFEKAGIDIDVFGFEPGWQTHAYSCSYVWDKGRFPDHQKLIDNMKEKGYKINLWEHLFTHPSSPIYEELLDACGSYEVWQGLVPDFALKKARDVFRKHHKEYLIDNGIDGFKVDECDNSDFKEDSWSFPEFSEFPSGLDGEQMHCLIGILYQQLMMSIFREKNQRTYGLIRSSHALASSYPFVLYTDLYNHKTFIKGCASMGFSGLLFTPELRAASGVEDLIRRMQALIFSPMALINAWNVKYPPWLQPNSQKNMAGEFLENKEKIEKIAINLFNMRKSIVPYLYAAFGQYMLTGRPPFRALALDYPEDKAAAKIDNVFMAGDSLLIAPVISGENGIKVYLPEGTWFNFFTEERYEGQKEYQFTPDLNEMLVFVKNNSLIPIAKPVKRITADTVFELTVKVYGNNPEPIVLFEDDGETFDYEKKIYNLVTLTYNDNSGSVKREGNYAKERYNITEWKKI